MHTGTAHLPLHGGKAPIWLFKRMEKLAREIIIAIVEEYGPKEVLLRLSDPYWFQSFGSVLGYDWHSSGLTTTVCGAVKSGLKGLEEELGLFVAGGKGKTSRKTPSEIMSWAEKVSLSRSPEEMVYTSKIVAKVDNNAVQDGYQLYHHNYIFTRDGDWSIVQQGMNGTTGYARRYHWMSDFTESFVSEPGSKVCDDQKYTSVLNLVSHGSDDAKKVISELACENPDKVIKEYKKLYSYAIDQKYLQRGQYSLLNNDARDLPISNSAAETTELELKRKSIYGDLEMPRREWVSTDDIKPQNLHKILLSTYEKSPDGFENVLAAEGMGPKSIRALTLLSEITFGTRADWQDPVKYTFAHGGKDGYPYPVDTLTYDRSIQALREIVQKAKISRAEKKEALQKLV